MAILFQDLLTFSTRLVQEFLILLGLPLVKCKDYLEKVLETPNPYSVS